MIICARNGCDVTFDKKTHNQKYCTDECCKIATNERVMEKYYERQAQRQGKARYCKTCNGRLSRYNDGQVCSPCKASKTVAANNQVVDMLANASLTA